MSNTVFCKKYQQELPALLHPPFPGSKGQQIALEVSQKAWQEWLKYQTMLINEKHLNMMDATSRAFLSEQMDKFFTNAEDLEPVAGYVAPESNG